MNKKSSKAPAKGRAKSDQGVNVRLQAAKVLHKVLFEHLSLDDALEQHREKVSAIDRALLQVLSYGVLRWKLQLEEWLQQLSGRPLKNIKPPARILTLLGLYQLRHTRIPSHAAIHVTVECAVRFNAPKAKGFINAILRQYLRSEEAAELIENNMTRYAHPEWMLKRFQADWPDEWENIANSNNRHVFIHKGKRAML